jgi:hypothetical protein
VVLKETQEILGNLVLVVLKETQEILGKQDLQEISDKEGELAAVVVVGVTLEVLASVDSLEQDLLKV